MSLSEIGNSNHFNEIDHLADPSKKRPRPRCLVESFFGGPLSKIAKIREETIRDISNRQRQDDILKRSFENRFDVTKRKLPIKSPQLEVQADETALYTGPDLHDEEENVLIPRGAIFYPIGKGKFHKVWSIKKADGTQIVAKTFKGDVRADKQNLSIEDTLSAYASLQERANELKDIRVATFFKKDIRADGMYICEYVPKDVPSFEDVKELIIKMIINPELFIADFRPANVRIRDNEIVIIDPSFVEKNIEFSFELAHIIVSWFGEGKKKILDPFGLKAVISEFNRNQTFTEEARNRWNETVKLLETWLEEPILVNNSSYSNASNSLGFPLPIFI